MEFLAELHPQVVHFPIAILILYSVLEIIGIIINNNFLNKTSHLLLSIGVLTAIAAVLTGNQAAEFAASISKVDSIEIENLIEEHETYATYTLWFFVAILVGRTYLVLQKKFTGKIKYVFIPIVLFGVFLIYETGEHGGKLVYDHGVGIDSINKKSNIYDSENGQ